MKKKKSGGGGANWMDTYGDMVTLLMCFFVMLYSMSSVDEEKWMALVESFNPQAAPQDQTGAIEGQSQIAPITQDDVDQAIEKIYEKLSDFVTESQLESQVSISKGSGHIFISFDDTVFFSSDSFILRDEGKVILDGVTETLMAEESFINEIRVLGHTAQGLPDRPNDPTFDRFLASNRATVVTIYLQEKNFIDPARLISVSYGQWRPVSSNETSSERAKNRRVELIISGLEVGNETGDSITQYYTMREEGGDLPSGMQNP